VHTTGRMRALFALLLVAGCTSVESEGPRGALDCETGGSGPSSSSSTGGGGGVSISIVPCVTDPETDPCGVECSGLTFVGCACPLECPQAPRGWQTTCDTGTGECGMQETPPS
jgi:hypothetical protein